MPPAQRRPVHRRRIPRPRRRVHVVIVLEHGRLFAIQPDLAQTAVGRHTFDVEVGVVFAADGRQAVRADLCVDDVVGLEHGAGEDGGGEGVRGEERGEVVVGHFPEVARRACEVGWIAGVDAALVARAGAAPGADVVAFFDGEGCELVAGGGGGHGGDARLRELFALVDPDRAAEDGQVVGFVYVDHVAGTSVGVFGRYGDQKGDVTQVEGPAAGEEPEDYVVAWR